MTRVSSNLTLVFKVFLPVFWVVFFGFSTLATFFLKEEYVGNIPMFIFRVGAVAFFVLGVITLYFTFWQFKRVEMDTTHLYVSDYFKNVRYTWDSIQQVEEKDWFLYKTVVVTLKSKGMFGHKIKFMASNKFWKKFVAGKEELMKMK